MSNFNPGRYFRVWYLPDKGENPQTQQAKAPKVMLTTRTLRCLCC